MRYSSKFERIIYEIQRIYFKRNNQQIRETDSKVIHGKFVVDSKLKHSQYRIKFAGDRALRRTKYRQRLFQPQKPQAKPDKATTIPRFTTSAKNTKDFSIRKPEQQKLKPLFGFSLNKNKQMWKIAICN